MPRVPHIGCYEVALSSERIAAEARREDPSYGLTGSSVAHACSPLEQTTIVACKSRAEVRVHRKLIMIVTQSVLRKTEVVLQRSWIMKKSRSRRANRQSRNVA